MSDIDENDDMYYDERAESPQSPLVAGGDEDDDEDVAEELSGTNDLGDEFLYVYYNRQYYRIPKAKDGKPGWTRLYNRTIKVANGKLLGELNAGSTTAWDQLVESKGVTADKVVVLVGKIKEEDPVMHNVWCILAEVEDSEGKADHKIVRHIPRNAYKTIWDQIFMDPTMKESSLLKMPPYQDNAKAYNPIVNGLVKMQGEAQPKSAMVAVPKTGKKNTLVEPADEAHPLKKSKASPGEVAEKPTVKRGASSDGPSNEGKPPQQAKKTQISRPSGSSFFKPKSPAGAEKVQNEAPRSPLPTAEVTGTETMMDADATATKNGKSEASKKSVRAEETPSNMNGHIKHMQFNEQFLLNWNPGEMPKSFAYALREYGKPTGVKITAEYIYN
tara:strand:+ start:7813 stop:8973 length:1161 start_codon:yes stop_codon:yes gene_type:complete